MITRIVSGPLVLFIIIHPKLGNIFTTIDGLSTIPLGDQCLTNAKFIIPTYHDAANVGYQTIHVTTWSVIVIPLLTNTSLYKCRNRFVCVPSQWGTTLQCNVVPHWLGAYTKWSCKCQSLPMVLIQSSRVFWTFISCWQVTIRRYSWLNPQFLPTGAPRLEINTDSGATIQSCIIQFVVRQWDLSRATSRSISG